MPRYVALFRGINVGKAKRIAMDDLRQLLGKLGFRDVQTLLNSGNAVFAARATSATRIATLIRTSVQRELGVDALVVVKSAGDIAAVMADNELEDVASDDSRLLVALSGDPGALIGLRKLARQDWGAERLQVGKHAAYLWCAQGILESKVADALLGGLKDTGTTRNWSTLRKIHRALGSDDS